MIIFRGGGFCRPIRLPCPRACGNILLGQVFFISLLNTPKKFDIMLLPKFGGTAMKIEIFGKDYNVSDSLKAITEKKCAKLDKYFNDDDDAVAKFVVTLEGGTYTTDMTVVYRSQSYRAEASSPSPFDNIDEVIPRLLGQIRKQKDIWGKTKRGAENVYEEEEV